MSQTVVDLPIWENRIEAANKKIRDLESRNAALERVLKAMCRRCPDRAVGLCDAGCPARYYCNTEGLETIHWDTLQEREQWANP